MNVDLYFCSLRERHDWFDFLFSLEYYDIELTEVLLQFVLKCFLQLVTYMSMCVVQRDDFDTAD